MSQRIVALIPARAGSKRVPGKNTRELAGHPLLAYAIGAAQEAGIFWNVEVSTEDSATFDLAIKYGASVSARPFEMAKDDSPDIEWVRHTITQCAAFAIIRPTSPFRRGAWIRAAWDILREAEPPVDSIRAMTKVREHPAKMWVGEEGHCAVPVLAGIGSQAPHHSMPTQRLRVVWKQTAALEMAWTRVLPASISGLMVLPYISEPDAPESIDINTEADWQRAEQMAAEHPEWLPPVSIARGSTPL